MKKILLILLMFFTIPAFADTMPFYTDSIPKESIGMYQTDSEIQIYSHPDSNSKVLNTMKFSYNPETMPDNVFALLLNEKKLGFLYVVDIGDEGWVEVIYNKKTGAKAWVQTADQMQFLPWRIFYNLYGKKYGLRFSQAVFKF